MQKQSTEELKDLAAKALENIKSQGAAQRIYKFILRLCMAGK